MRYRLYFFSYNDQQGSVRMNYADIPDGFFYLTNDEFKMEPGAPSYTPIYRDDRYRLWHDGIYVLLEPQRTFCRNAFFVPETHPFFNIYVVDRVVLGEGSTVNTPRKPIISKDHPAWKRFNNLLRNYF